jgi:biotin operon repressor
VFTTTDQQRDRTLYLWADGRPARPTSTQQRVMAELSRHDEMGPTWQTAQEIAAELGYRSAATVHHAIVELREAGVTIFERNSRRQAAA